LIPISPRFSDPPSWLKLRTNTIPGHLLSTGHLAQHGSKDVGHHQQIMGVSLDIMGKMWPIHGSIIGYNGLMWVKECHKPPMTGNGNHTTYKNGDD